MDPALVFWPTLTLVGGVTAVLVFSQFRRGSLLSPFSMTMFMLVSIFGVRPLLMLNSGRFDYYGIDVASGFAQAAVLGFVACAALTVGYAYSRMTRREELNPTPPESSMGEQESRTISVVAAFWAVVFLLVLWTVIMMAVGGGFGFVAQLFGGRSAELNAGAENLPVVVPALPAAGALILAIARITSERVRALSRFEVVLFWLGIFLAIVPPATVGTRRFLIPALLAALMAATFRDWRKFLGVPLAFLALAGFIALAIFPFVRSAGSRTGSSDLLGAMVEYFEAEGLVGSLEGFFLSYDTEMFNYVSYLVPRLGDSIPFGMGRGTIGDILLTPLPSALAPYESWSNQLLRMVFGTVCGEGVCPVPSLVGVLYYDFSYVGLIAGFLTLGLVFGRFESAFLKSKGVRLVLLLTAGCFVPIIIRGNSVGILWIAFNVFVVVVFAYLVLSRSRRHQSGDTLRPSAHPFARTTK